MRHFQKVESEDEEEVKEEKKALFSSLKIGTTNVLGNILGRKKEIPVSNAAESSSSTSSEEEAEKEDHERKDPDPETDPNKTRKATRRKRVLMKHADYCFVTRTDTLGIFTKEIDPLVRKGGVYYDVFDKEGDGNKKIVVVYFEDEVIDFMAEILQVKARLNEFDCLVPFRCYAADMFERFNSRQIQSIIMQTFSTEFDIDYLEKSKVILEHFPMHTDDRQAIEESWMKYRWRLAFGFLTGKWE